MMAPNSLRRNNITPSRRDHARTFDDAHLRGDCCRQHGNDSTDASSSTNPTINNYRNCGEVCADGDAIYYSAAHRMLNQHGYPERTQVLSSSNADGLVNFSAGPKDV